MPKNFLHTILCSIIYRYIYLFVLSIALRIEHVSRLLLFCLLFRYCCCCVIVLFFNGLFAITVLLPLLFFFVVLLRIQHTYYIHHPFSLNPPPLNPFPSLHLVSPTSLHFFNSFNTLNSHHIDCKMYKCTHLLVLMYSYHVRYIPNRKLSLDFTV